MGRANQKASKKGGGAVITFDAGARKEFLTGFRKRKNERRQHARQKIAETVRNEKLEERKERREATKAATNFQVLDDDDDDDDDDEPENAEVNTYQFGDSLATTVVESLLPEDEEEDLPRAPLKSGGDKGEAAPKPKAKKFNLKQSLATAIPGFKPKVLSGGGSVPKKKKEGGGKKKILSKKKKAQHRSMNFAKDSRQRGFFS
tara:strand:- start:589 stop:1197 length:609 start_codon:yes stop_codon:yes gene_type:complete